MMPVQGLSQGAQPIMSYNYGAGNIDRVKKASTVSSSEITSYLTRPMSRRNACSGPDEG